MRTSTDNKLSLKVFETDINNIKEIRNLDTLKEEKDLFARIISEKIF